MPEIIVPGGDEVLDPKDETKEMINIITQPSAINVDAVELKRAQKDIQGKSTVIITQAEVEVAIQRQLAGWANWFAMFYPRMPNTVESALDVIGYKLVKKENTSEPIR